MTRIVWCLIVVFNVVVAGRCSQEVIETHLHKSRRLEAYCTFHTEPKQIKKMNVSTCNIVLTLLSTALEALELDIKECSDEQLKSEFESKQKNFEEFSQLITARKNTLITLNGCFMHRNNFVE